MVEPSDTVDRIMARTQMDDTSGCLLWQGATTAAGYGTIRVDGDNRYTHRVMYEAHHGPLPDKKPNVCHTCDRPACVNPDHLWAGDDADNMQDASERGRFPDERPEYRGESHHDAKLSEDDVVEIRELYASDGYTQSRLAEQFDINQTEVGFIVRGEYWSDAPGPTTTTGRGRNGADTGVGGGNRKLSADDVVEIRRRCKNENMSQYDLADDYGISRSAVAAIVRGESWPDAGGPTT
jgi:DNA-binding XRE family transcriptional regulator